MTHSMFLKISNRKPRLMTWLILAFIAQFGMPAAGAAPESRSSWQAVDKEASSARVVSGGQRTLTSDPFNDTHGTLATQLDIDQFSATIVDGNLVFSVSFFNSITPADSGEANAMVGFIDIDIDQDAATGALSDIDIFCPELSGMGMDFDVNLGTFDSATGQADLEDSTLTAIASIDVTFTANSFTATIPLALLGGDDGIANVATVLGTVDEPTDCAPNGGFITTDFGSMINVSTNAHILDGNGFVVGVIVNDGPVRVALTGESNGALGAPIADASIELIEILSNEVLASNDDCSGDDVAELEEIIGRSLGAATDACLVLTLDIGLYGLRLKDATNGAGFGLAGATQKR